MISSFRVQKYNNFYLKNSINFLVMKWHETHKIKYLLG